MKVTKSQSAENRQGIVDAAARLYRERGLQGVGVADITRDAGLTLNQGSVIGAVMVGDYGYPHIYEVAFNYPAK